MPFSLTTDYRDPALASRLAGQIRQRVKRPLSLMEVCGTHTVSIFRHGIRSFLPREIKLLSGPGCPVCVTSQADIDAFIALCRQPHTIVTTFGDLIRVPGSNGSLQSERAEGRDVRVVYSAMDALAIARQNPGNRVVFLGVGFETTIPTVAATILTAKRQGITNFSVYPAFKTVPPALCALIGGGRIAVDGLLLPGHVSVIIGLSGYEPFFKMYPLPCVVAGFEPTDILQAIAMLVSQVDSGVKRLENGYPRVVGWEGNGKALEMMDRVFMPADAKWRGLGLIPESGRDLKPVFSEYDASRIFDLAIAPADEPRGCACANVLTGEMVPPECPLYGTVCTPMDPTGPCMVSSEGTCAAYYRYHENF